MLRRPMILHRTSGRTALGVSLALATAALWATLPVALKFALEQLDALTLTWFRFLLAFMLFGAWIAARGRQRELLALDRQGFELLAVAAVMLIGNYVLYLLGLHRTTPANSQVLMQLAPLLLAAGGVLVFGERLSRGQWLAFGALCLGLALFFWDRLSAVALDLERYIEGSALIVGAALVWAVYAMAQKQLLRQLSSHTVLCVIFGLGAVALLPFADFTAFAQIDAWHWVAVVFCALNTLAAYGAFAEALVHAEASRVSVVLALNPLLTMLVVGGAHEWIPSRFPAMEIDWLGYVGAACVVAGSAATSLFGRRRVSSHSPTGRSLVEGASS